MAEELRIGAAHVKERSPLGVWLLIVVTLGIYGLVHWYKINREMRDYSQEAGAPLGNDPTLSLLALFPGGIVIVPAIWTWVTTTQRAQAVRRMAADGPTEVPSLFLGVLLGFLWATNHPYLQSSLNATWRMAGATGIAPAQQAPEPAA
jgi:ABC-type Fe3+ transport system permease subunit